MIFKILRLFLITFFFMINFIFSMKFSKEHGKRMQKIRKNFNKVLISKSNYYVNKKNSELEDYFVQKVKEYEKKENIKSYAFTTNYIFHADAFALFSVVIFTKFNEKSIELLNRYRKILMSYNFKYQTKTGKSYTELGIRTMADPYAYGLSYSRINLIRKFERKVHHFLVQEQTKYNNNKKVFCTEILKKSSLLKKYINELVYFMDKKYYEKWIAHKTKAKKENWPIADNNGK